VGCQETSRELAWAYLRCAPSTVEVRVEVTPAFSGSLSQAVSRAAQLERVMSSLLLAYGRLSLLVDGVDPLGALVNDALDETYDAQTRPRPAQGLGLDALGQYGYVETRESLPLEGLKGRVAMLVENATKGDYEIAAGPLTCVGPAFEEAWAMLEALVPAMCEDTDGEEGFEICSVDRSAGLYRVLDGTNTMLSLEWGAGK
jgi:hypothetical protein